MAAKRKVNKKPRKTYSSIFVVLAFVMLLAIFLLRYRLNIFQEPRRDVINTESSMSSQISSTPYPTIDISKYPLLYSERTIDTSDWKIYTDTMGGFSFKYPNDWTVTDPVVNPGNGPKSHAYKILGPNGQIMNMAFGNGFGGGCEASHQRRFTFFKSQTTLCSYSEGGDNTELSQLYEDFGDYTLSVDAQNVKGSDSMSIVIGILYSFYKTN